MIFGKRPRALVVELEAGRDHPLIQRLADAGYDVSIATSGSDAVLECELQPPDVLLLDVDLPDLDGYDVCHCVRHIENGKHVLVVLMAEACDPVARFRSRQMVDFAGGDFFLTKPCDGELLVALLDEELGRTGLAHDVWPRRFPTRVVWPTRRARSDRAATATLGAT